MNSALYVLGNSSGESQGGSEEGKVGPLNLHVVTCSCLGKGFRIIMT